MLWVDIETRSRVDLKKHGVYKYVEDPEFAILMACWSNDGETVHAALGTDIELIPGLWDPSVVKVAHNAQFERVCFSAIDGTGTGWQDPACWLDTASLAAEYGHPVSLEAAAKSLGAVPKDSAGKALVRLFTKPNREGGWNDETTHPLEWLDFIAYCEQDVLTMIDVHRRLGKWPNDMERLVWNTDQRINDRGMRIDLEMCELAAKAVEANRVANALDFRLLTGVDNPASQPQVMRWAAEVGLELPNLRAETIEAALARSGLALDHREALELRQELALAAGGKFTAAVDVVSPDSRIRGGFRFFGAHTGRWTGQRVQPQNLPRATIKHPEAAILDLKLGLGATPHELKALVRAMFVGPYSVVDYASIEARVVAWLAGEEWALQAFRDGRDIYVETAKRMGGMTRAEGKIAVLALGYNGGINSLKALGGDALGATDEQLTKLVQIWRKANSRIVKLWATMADAIDDGARVGEHLRIVRYGRNSMRMELPSGRAIHYHGVAWEKYRVKDPVTGKLVVKESWRYNDPKKGGQRIGTYGGRLVENATQAIARDILAEALVRLEDAGYPVVGHVHDEVIVEDDQLEDIVRIMTEVPSWAKGMPIDAEGFRTYRYRKG